jgi:hypothetical protein
MKTTEQLFADFHGLSASLASLESQHTEKGLPVPPRPADLANLPGSAFDFGSGAAGRLALEASLASLESHVGKLRVAVRLSSPLRGVASETPAAPTAPTPAASVALDAGAIRQAIASGKLNAAALTAASKIQELERVRAGLKQNSTSHRAVTSRISALRKSFPSLTPGK